VERVTSKEVPASVERPCELTLRPRDLNNKVPFGGLRPERVPLSVERRCKLTPRAPDLNNKVPFEGVRPERVPLSVQRRCGLTLRVLGPRKSDLEHSN
jgi:hypothetical protein